AVRPLAAGAGLGDALSIALLLPWSALGTANASAAGLEVVQQLRRRARGNLRQMGARGKIRDGLAQGWALPVRIDHVGIAAQAVELGLDRDDERPLIQAGRIERGQLRARARN